jgi:hypothetical protein
VDGKMKNILDKVGTNAGKVWKTLDVHGSLIQNELIETTRLKEEEVYAAIGWLARENKIYKDGIIYKLGATNLIDKIGVDAGKIWDILNSWGKVDAFYLSKLAELTKEDAYCALGWLAKEGKIKVKKIKPKRPQTIFELRK